MNKKIIILGASGFIGKALSDELNKLKKNFIGLSSKECNLVENNSVDLIQNLINDNDTLVFISAIAPCKDEEMYEKNITMIDNFIKGISQTKISNILYISSDAVYEDSMSLISENNNKTSSNMHAKMHKKREEILINYCNTNNLGLTILRPTLVYGPGDTHNGYGPNQFIRDINNNKDILLFGEGEEKRDHIYITDVIKVIISAIDNQIFGNFTLATGKVFSFYDIAKIICKAKGISENRIKFKKRVGPMPHNGYRAFNISELRNKFYNLKITDIELGIKNSIEKLL